MKAMILAAGKGERMRPLTNSTPKPLLTAGGKPLLEHWLLRLEALANIEEVVINTAYLGEQIADYVSGRDGIKIALSAEGEPLETGGAIRRAAPLLGDEPFLLVNGDVYCDVDLAVFTERPVTDGGAHLLLVANPAHNTRGDFALVGDTVCLPAAELAADEQAGQPAMTFAGVSMISPAMIALHPEGESFALREPLFKAIAAGKVTAEAHTGFWLDVGTPCRLAQLDEYLASKSKQ